jgi:DNA transformation protein
MPAKPNPYIDFLIEQLSPLGEITARAMFGGHCLYADGFVFALVANNELYLKADDENRGMFETGGLLPFKPFEDKDEVMSYYQAPPEIFEDSAEMRRWCRPAIEASMRKKRLQAKSKAITS